jgi:hypothetical protein
MTGTYNARAAHRPIAAGAATSTTMARFRHIVTPGLPFMGRRRRGSRVSLLWLVLAAFALRALIPIGFMPAADGSLSLQICDEGLPAWLLLHAADGAPHGQAMPAGPVHHSHEDHCPFCGGTTPAPGPLLLALACAVWVAIATVAILVSFRAPIRLLHVPQARAPPLPA